MNIVLWQTCLLDAHLITCQGLYPQPQTLPEPPSARDAAHLHHAAPRRLSSVSLAIMFEELAEGNCSLLTSIKRHW